MRGRCVRLVDGGTIEKGLVSHAKTSPFYFLFSAARPSPLRRGNSADAQYPERPFMPNLFFGPGAPRPTPL